MHWGCAFFRHCWNEGLKLSTLNNCPESSDKYIEYRQDTVNRRFVHERIKRIHPGHGRRIKINEVDDHPRKDMLILGGLIAKNNSVNMSGRKDSDAHLA
jgi:hypothetical protein